MPLDRFDDFPERSLIHIHQVPGFWKTAARHVLGVFLECSNTLGLQPFVFLEEVPVCLGMAGNAFVVVSEDVV